MDPFILQVRLTPRAARNQIDGWQGDVLRIRVTAPPVEGRANDALLRLLSKALDLPPSRLQLLRGHASRNKVIAVERLSGEEIRRRLDVAAAKSGSH